MLLLAASEVPDIPYPFPVIPVCSYLRGAPRAPLCATFGLPYDFEDPAPPPPSLFFPPFTNGVCELKGGI
jgi:hypothetical protein